MQLACRTRAASPVAGTNRQSGTYYSPYTRGRNIRHRGTTVVDMVGALQVD